MAQFTACFLESAVLLLSMDFCLFDNNPISWKFLSGIVTNAVIVINLLRAKCKEIISMEKVYVQRLVKILNQG